MKPSQTHVDSDTLHVLIVEDDISISHPMTILLHHYGYKTRVATTLTQALVLVEAKPVVVILDLQLPDGHGSKVLEKLMLMNSKSKTIVLSADDAEQIKKKLNWLKPEAVFSKPLDFLAILKRLRPLLPNPDKGSSNVPSKFLQAAA